MANFLTLSAAPELLYSVLEYLEPADTFSLLLTCRNIHPIAYKHLWRTIHLYNHSRWRAGMPRSTSRMRRFYQGAITRTPAVAALEDKTSDKLASIIDTLGPQDTGLPFTRKLVFHPRCLKDTHGFFRSSLAKNVGDLMQDGVLNINCVQLSLDVVIDGDGNGDGAVSRFLTQLKEYSESKPPEQFSIILATYLDKEVPRIIHIERITVLNLNIRSADLSRSRGVVLGDDSDAYSDPEPESDSEFSDASSYQDGTAYKDKTQFNTEIAERLTSLLSRCENLLTLTIHMNGIDNRPGARYVDLKLSPHLQDLQAAFYNLPKLRKLTFRSTLFHPSFFIAPPESTRTVNYEGLLSNRWFQSFKKCPFTNVKQLSIHINPDSYNQSLRCKPDFEPQPLGDIAVSSLTSFSYEETSSKVHIPDIIPCILRRNKNLDRTSKEKLLADITARFQRSAEKRLITACKNSLDSIRDTEGNDTLFEIDPTGHPSPRQDGIKAAGDRCLKMLPDAIDNIEPLKSARASAETFAAQCEKNINSLLERYKAMLTVEYTQKRLNGEMEHPDDIETASKQCLQRMLDNFNDHAWWSNSRPQILRTLNITKCGIENQIQDFTERRAEEYVLGLAESGELENLDPVMASEKFTRDCAMELGTMEFVPDS
ncbi:hypothetical protein TWF481_000454 [Arthrobotrys musiformis]|uniref:F-box domain-containing protein n=1 Tax=Arthrobotrys musiformis TaxID=47236 RepID=A0AAV9WPM8_9PEZI